MEKIQGKIHLIEIDERAEVMGKRIFRKNIREFESSNVKAVSYDSSTNFLYIMFKGDSVYKYNRVSKEEFNKIKEADSIGKVSGQIIKGKDYIRIL